jgi:uncharacterized protein with PIN domain
MLIFDDCSEEKCKKAYIVKLSNLFEVLLMPYKCPACGGPLVYVRTEHIGIHKYDIYKCTECGRYWKVEVGVSTRNMAGAVAARRRIFGR